MRTIITCPIVVITFLLFLCMCTSDIEPEKSVTIDISDGYTNKCVDISCSLMIDSFKYIKLETQKTGLIDIVADLQYYDSLIFVLNSNHKEILVFNTDGSLAQTFKRKGYGPGEYIYITDFCYNTNNNELVVLDHVQRKAICYSLSDQSYKEYNLPVAFSKIINYQDIYAFIILPRQLNELWPYHLYTTDSRFQEIERLEYSEVYKKYPKREMLNTDFYLSGNELIFWNRYGDTISSYELFTNHKLNLTQKIIIVNKINPLPVDKYLDILNYYGYSLTYYTDKYLIFHGNKKKQPVFIFYSFENKNCLSSNLYNTIGLINDIDGGPNFFPHGMAGKNVLYQVINYNSKVCEKLQNPQQIFAYKQMFNSLSINDNPIIQLAFFKTNDPSSK